MATAARWREAVLGSVIFRFHPDLKGTELLLDPTMPDAAGAAVPGLDRPRFEGGDFLVLSRDVVAVEHVPEPNADLAFEDRHAFVSRMGVRLHLERLRDPKPGREQPRLPWAPFEDGHLARYGPRAEDG